MSGYVKTPRSTLKRAHKRGHYDKKTVHAILDEALVCHVAVLTDRGVMNIPSSHWRIDDTLYIHGASKGASILALEGGAEACIVVSLLDGVVFARSVYAHSVNFRSVMIYATGHVVEGDDKIKAVRGFIDKYAKDRWDQLRPPTKIELKATKIIAFKITEASAKIRSAPPGDEDLDVDVWAGVVPLKLCRQTEQPCLKAEPTAAMPMPLGLLPNLK